MKSLLLFLIVVLAVCNAYIIDDSSLNPLSDEFISLVNLKAKTWKAGRNFHRDTSMEHIKRIMGALPLPKELEPPTSDRVSDPNENYPENFDSRTAWPQCPTLRKLTDQGDCGSCWAVSSVLTMSDRTCTLSNGLHQFYYSIEDVLACCPNCGFGCDGGYQEMAYLYWINHGSVTGGPYNSSEGCDPYLFPPCEHHEDGSKPDCESLNGTTPLCHGVCRIEYPEQYEYDLHFGHNFYAVNKEKEIMFELINYGPLSTTFMVFEDFLSYKSGVYSYTDGKKLGWHAIRILGYGTENGIPYWLCANSWNAGWGDKGYFKIRRGNNECNVEYGTISPFPDFHRHYELHH